MTTADRIDTGFSNQRFGKPKRGRTRFRDRGVERSKMGLIHNPKLHSKVRRSAVWQIDITDSVTTTGACKVWYFGPRWALLRSITATPQEAERILRFSQIKGVWTKDLRMEKSTTFCDRKDRENYLAELKMETKQPARFSPPVHNLYRLLGYDRPPEPDQVMELVVRGKRMFGMTFKDITLKTGMSKKVVVRLCNTPPATAEDHGRLAVLISTMIYGNP